MDDVPIELMTAQWGQYDCYDWARALLAIHGYSMPSQEKAAEGLAKTDKAAWALVLFELNPEDWHVGVVLPGCETFAHMAENTHVTIERLDNRFWDARIEGYYRRRDTASPPDSAVAPVEQCAG